MGIDAKEKSVARAGLRSINSVSIEKNLEYFFFIYRSGSDYRATIPETSGLDDSITEDAVDRAKSKIPAGSKITAFAHTHGKALAGTFYLQFSPEDVRFARGNKWNAYLATPSSELVVLDCSDPRDQFPREAL